jgi:hypothetical protein
MVETWDKTIFPQREKEELDSLVLLNASRKGFQRRIAGVKRGHFSTWRCANMYTGYSNKEIKTRWPKVVPRFIEKYKIFAFKSPQTSTAVRAQGS